MIAIKAIFFDLDYTLYDMETYVRGAFEDVAAEIATQCSLGSRQLYDSLFCLWQRVGTDYNFLFDDWLQEHGLVNKTRVQQCIEIFHEHRPNIWLYAGAQAMLTAFRRDYFLGLITDGNIRMQRRKVEVLGLEDKFDTFVYAKHLGLAKPDSRVFEYALARAGSRAGEAVYIGDHPIKDIVGARSVGMRAVRVLTGEFCSLPNNRAFEPINVVEGLSQIPHYVNELCHRKR